MYIMDDSLPNWTDVFQVFIAFIGMIAAVIGAAKLIRRDKDKEAQIDKLTKVAAQLAQMKAVEIQKLNLSVKPEMRIIRSMYNGTDGELDITIENIGERAVLQKFELLSDDLILHNEHLPHILQKDTNRKIFCRTKGEKHIKDCTYQINIHYVDKIGNLYVSTVKGKGHRNKIGESKLQLIKGFLHG